MKRWFGCLMGVVLSLGLNLTGSQATAAPSAFPRGAISGSVIERESGQGASDALVEIFSCGDETPSGNTATDPSGAYRIESVERGCYLLRVSRNGYESSWYGSPPFKESAIGITVGNDPVTGIDVPISLAGALIHGRVKDENGQPLAGVWATAVSLKGPGENSISDGRTDDQGRYTIQVAPGKIVMVFVRPGYVAQIYGGFRPAPKPIDLAGGNTLTGIDMTLVRGGKISGRVTDEQGHALAGIRVTVQGELLPVFSVTGKDGRFLLDGVPSGDHRIVFSDPDQELLSQWFDGQDNIEKATPVKVLAPGTVTGIKAVLRKAGGISGWVTDHEGNGIPGVMVLAKSTDQEALGSMAETGPTGEYTITGLATGRYTVNFEPYGKPYLARHFPDRENPEDALPIEVKAPNLTYGINQVLPSGAALSGTVRNTGGEPISDCFIWVYPATGEESRMAGSGFCDPEGSYTITLPPGEYLAEFVGRGAYLGRWSGGHAERSDAEPVVVTSDGAVRLDAVLPLGGSASGTVRNRLGKGVAGIKVRATDLATGKRSRSGESREDGSYTIQGLETGQYTLVATGSKVGYVRGKYPQPVSVRAPNTTEAIDFVMTLGGSLQGVVRDGNGVPLPGVKVEVHDPEIWSEIASTRTDDTGSYLLGGIPAGSYCIRFAEDEYMVQWYGDKFRREEAEKISIVGSDTLSGLDAVLTKGVPLTGLVNSSTGILLDHAKVEIYGEIEDEPFDTVYTGVDGRFTVPSLAPGSYRGRFGHDDHIPQWFGGRVRRQADKVTIGDTTPPDLAVTLTMGEALVAGKMLNTDGEDVGQAWMTAIDAATGQEVADERICECNGKFHIPLPSGRYKLRVERYGKVYWYGAGENSSVRVLAVDDEVSGLKVIIGD